MARRELLVLDDDLHDPLLLVDDRDAARPWPGESAFITKVIGSSLHSTMSIFSPRSSRMIDCTRVPFMPDAGAHRVHVLLARDHRHLGALARLAHAAPDLDGAVVDLGHLHLEQLDEQGGIGAAHHHLRALGGLQRP